MFYTLRTQSLKNKDLLIVNYNLELFLIYYCDKVFYIFSILDNNKINSNFEKYLDLINFNEYTEIKYHQNESISIYYTYLFR